MIKYDYNYFLNKAALIISFVPLILFSQSGDQNPNYEILRNQVDLYRGLYELDDYQKYLLMTVDSLESEREYELAEIYLSEILDMMQTEREDQDEKKNNIEEDDNFRIELTTGIDFNRHEFESGYIQDDSVLTEELNKPFMGLRFLYDYKNLFNIYNAIHYDKENLKNDYGFFYNKKNFNISYNSYYNSALDSSFSSYWENQISVLNQNNIFNQFDYKIRNMFYYKIYLDKNPYWLDFYRNSLELSLEKYLLGLKTSLLIAADINETLGAKENDYQEFRVTGAYQSDIFRKFRHQIAASAGVRNYTFLLTDSLYMNRYNIYQMELSLGYDLNKTYKIEIENELSGKYYKNTSDFEADYLWNYFKPVFYINVFTDFELGIGYENELKKHASEKEEEILISEQDYISNGLFGSLDYSRDNGLLVSLSASYQKRRYDNSVTNELLNIYSNTNIFALTAYIFVPLYKNINLNVFGVYDNDQDIDQSDIRTQSTIFNVELQYQL